MAIDLYIDYESRGTVDIEEVGLHNYVWHPETQPLFLSFAFGKEKTRQWLIYEGQSIPRDLHDGFRDPSVDLIAYNSAFERHTTNKIGYPVGPDRFIDPQVCGRTLSLPGSLEIQGTVMDLPPELQKLAAQGKRLIDFFCMPQKHTITQVKKGLPAIYWNDWNTHPNEWGQFLEYGAGDVPAERELLRRYRLLNVWPQTPFERRLWLFDQKVNDRGMPVDVKFVKSMLNIALKAKKEAKDAQNTITGLQNSNSRNQVLPWLKTRGYPYNTLRKETVDSAMKDPEVKMTPEAREVLRLRREASSTTYTKLPSILKRVSPDGRLKGQFVFLGSARCGRWAGDGVQLHNLARTSVINGHDFEEEDVMIEARKMIYAEDYEGLKEKYKQPLLVVKSLIRTVFVSP